MSGGRNGHGRRDAGGESREPGNPASSVVFGGMWLLLLVGSLLVAGPWAGFHGVLIGGTGLLMLLCPPVVAVPRLWWLLAALFLLAGAAAFLPAGWFAMPEWRQHLESLGIETGPLVAIQSRQAAETFGLFVVMVVGGLWLAGHRSSANQVRVWALAFTLGVAAFAILAKLMQDMPHGGHPGTDSHFGFFPNRNHTATYLAMGAICGLGNVFQALRDKRFLTLAVALAGTGVCLWAVAGWSLSRGGIVLVAIGCLAWLPMLGMRYLGKHGLWALGLIALATIGLFSITDSGVKNRIAKTAEMAGSALPAADDSPPEEAKPAADAPRDLDFRIPTAIDTLGLIRDFKWTGIGAGQFFYVFPQYRKLTAASNLSDSFHPESDWLWLAAETGVPATLALAALVILAFWQGRAAILGGRDRALRSACLVAALLVPIHGLFDVPGHRITLAWSAVLLCALALHAPSRAPSHAPLPPPPPAWPFRLAALVLLVLAGWLVRAEWWDGPPPALTTASTALQAARLLYKEDQALQAEALAKGQSYDPPPTEDRLEWALAIVKQAAPQAPLDRSLLRYQGFLAMHYDDRYALADHCFALELALDPTWVDGPLRQAQAWAPIDPQRCATLWAEALRRAAQLDRLHPGNPWSSEQTRQRIRQLAKGQPELEKLAPVAE